MIKKISKAESYFYQGETCSENQDYEGAIKNFTKAISVNKNFVEAYFERGEAYLDLYQYNKAIKDFTSAIKLDPKFAEAYMSRAEAYFFIEELDNVIADSSKAIELDSNLIEFVGLRADAYYEKGMYHEAIDDYNIDLEYDGDTESLFRRGECYLHIGQYFIALADFDIVLYNCIPDWDSLISYGTCLMNLTQNEEVIEISSEVLKHTKGFSLLHESIGVAYAGASHYADAIKFFTNAIKDDPTNGMLYSKRANCYRQLNKNKEADSDYQKYLKLAS